MRPARGKEKGSIHEGMEPDDRAEAQIESVQMDEGGGFAICRWISPREEGSVRSGVAIRWSRGRRIRQNVTSDSRNMIFDRLVSNTRPDMSAMHLTQGRSG